jgi:hypothetical protein
MALSIGLNWVGSVSEDGDRVRSHKRCFKWKKRPIDNVQKTIRSSRTSRSPYFPCWQELIAGLHTSSQLHTYIEYYISHNVDALLSNDSIKTPAARQRMRNKIHGSRGWITAWQTNMFPRKQLNYNNEERCFLRGPYLATWTRGWIPPL